MLEQVRIARARERYDAYPFELSGGMCQRVVIALALACRPQLLIADEPTTGLDVTTQKAVMDLIVELTRNQGMSTILITHDLGLAAAYCDRVLVMEKGRVVESSQSRTIFTAPTHPYTRKLMRATPRPGIGLRDLLPEDEMDRRPPTSPPLAKEPNGQAQRHGNRRPLLVVEELAKEYPRRGLAGGLSGRGALSGQPTVPFRAVDGISFIIDPGESVGLVGESGRGKSTTATMIMRLIDISQGRIVFDGQDIAAPAKSFAKLALRKRIQMVFQDPTDSLNPRFTAARAIADPIKGSAMSGVCARCGRAVRSWRFRWDCRWGSLTASRTSFRGDRRRELASRERSR
jgi:peptide/nickel transport system ATP-binding protein